MSDNDLPKNETPSEDDLIYFTSACGATTATSKLVSVLTAKEPLRGGGNVFIADDNHGAAALSTMLGQSS